jgi:thioredoxin reductase
VPQVGSIDAAVIGAGPAGISAALQLRRHGLTCVVFERERIGGSLNDAFLLRNVVGKPEGVSGKELVNELYASATNVNMMMTEILSVELSQGSFLLKHSKGETLSRSVILASGLSPRRLEDSVVSPKAQAAVHYSLGEILGHPIRRAAVIGGGDVAIDFACSLRAAGREVTVLMHSKYPVANHFVLDDAVRLGARMWGQFNTTHVEASGPRLRVVAADGRTLDCDAVLVAIGKERKVPFLSGTMKNCVKPSGPLSVTTSQPGLFLCGDILDEGRRYYHHALGTGLMAAESVFEYLAQGG